MLLLEVKLTHEPVFPPVGRLVGQNFKAKFLFYTPVGALVFLVYLISDRGDGLLDRLLVAKELRGGKNKFISHTGVQYIFPPPLISKQLLALS